jgi:hypothetical protein
MNDSCCISHLACHAALDVGDALYGRHPIQEPKNLRELERRYKEFFPYKNHYSFDGITLFADVLGVRDPLFQDVFSPHPRYLTPNSIQLRQGLFHQKLKRALSLLEAKALWPNITPINSFERENLEYVRKFLIDLSLRA